MKTTISRIAVGEIVEIIETGTIGEIMSIEGERLTIQPASITD